MGVTGDTGDGHPGTSGSLTVRLGSGTVPAVNPGEPTPQTLRELLHEVRTPLAALAAMAPVVEAATRGTYLAVLEHLSGIIHRGLECREPACTGDASSVDLSLAVTDAVRLVSAAHREDAFRVEAFTGISVRGDRVLLTQILVNLLANAARHSPSGESVEIRAFTDGVAVNVEIRDHGNGVPEHLRERVFADGASFGTHNGDGIGLALSRRLAEQMSGTLRLLDEPGAVFSLVLPAA
jgi:signal transduction histidine kinase